MSEIVVVGGGIAGMASAMLLARDGHHVTLLERDPAPPPQPAEAWADWERRGVNQFRLPHYFLARFREVAERELPDLLGALDAAGALRINPIALAPDAVTGGWREGDERFEQVTGRRPVVEATFARLAAAEPGVEIRRGVAVRGLVAADAPNGDVPHVVGVVTGDGERIDADLVVDAGGRRSALPDWLASIGARRPVDEAHDSGFVYYGRHFRSTDGTMPPMFGPPLQAYDSVSWLTLPADNGTWSVTLTASAKDPALRRARDVGTWERVVKAYPLIAHWVEAEPLTGIDVMAKIEDRVRHFTVEGEPVATGVAAVGDSWACTNPSVGRGASFALLHAVCLRDVLREVGTADHDALIRRWNEATDAELGPWVSDTLEFDRHRLAEIDAQIAGVPYETDDQAWKLGSALRGAAASDPDLLRSALSVAGVLARGVDVFSWPGIFDKVLAAGTPDPPPGPTRVELLATLED
jgi:2-polyprenyl-6-methoxyphenol hydroxylase-like FAD-dependent oxidoreductase